MALRWVLALLAISAIVPPGVAAEHPADPAPPPAVRQQEERRPFALGVSWSVTPRYSENVLAGPGGGSGILRRHIQDTSRLLAATFAPAEDWTVSIQWQHRSIRLTEEVIVGGVSQRSEEVSEDWGVSLGAYRRLPAGQAVQPRVGLMLLWPQRLMSVQIMLGYVRDPVVVSGSLRYSTSWAGAGADSAAVSLGVELIANDAVRLGAAVRHETPLRSGDPPVSVLMLRLGYAFGGEVRQEIGVDVGVWMRAGEGGISFGLGWYGQGAMSAPRDEADEGPAATVAPS